MRKNTILLWFTFFLLVSIITLILIISLGIIKIDTEWLKPTTIATLLGGLGGALAGTVLSGINASRQWEKQKAKENEESRYIFNKLILESLSIILVNKTSIMALPLYTLLVTNEKFGTGDDSQYLNDMDEASRAKQLFTSIEDDVEDLCIELESLYLSSDEMVKSKIVDWEIYSKLNYFKFVFRKTKTISSVRKLASSSDLKDEELAERIKNAEVESEELQSYRDIFNSRNELIILHHMALKSVNQLVEFKKDLSEKLDSKKSS